MANFFKRHNYFNGNIGIYPTSLEGGLRKIIEESDLKNYISIRRVTGVGGDVFTYHLSKGYPVIALVNNGGHYVLVVGHQNRKYYVHDNHQLKEWDEVRLDFTGLPHVLDSITTTSFTRGTIIFFERKDNTTHTSTISINDPNLSGVARSNFIKKTSNGYFPPSSNIGDLHQKVLIDAYSIDDSLEISINGTLINTLNFGRSSFWDMTGLVRNGNNELVITCYDNTGGTCWSTGFRVGDNTSWKINENYANNSCNEAAMPRKAVYRKSIIFSFTQ